MNILLWVENKILAEGIANILKVNPLFSVKGQVNGSERQQLLAEEIIHILIVSANCDQGRLIITVNKYREQYKELQVLLFADKIPNREILLLHKAGITGFIASDCDSADLLYAVDKIARGSFYIHPALGYRILEDLNSRKMSLSQIDPQSLNISGREIEVLRLLMEGYTSNKIAEKLFTSRRTVESHRRNLMEKTKTKNIAELIKFSICNQLIDPVPETSEILQTGEI